MAGFDVVGRCMERIRGRGLRVVFPEGGDERIVEAARRLKNGGIAEPVMLGDIEAGRIDVNGRLDAYAALYMQGRPDSN